MMRSDVNSRLSRLEALTVCGPALKPSVDEVLDEILVKQRDANHIPHHSIQVVDCIKYDTAGDCGDGMQNSSEFEKEVWKLEACGLEGVWVPLPESPFNACLVGGHPCRYFVFYSGRRGI